MKRGRPISAVGPQANGQKIRKLFASRPANIERQIWRSSERRIANGGVRRRLGDQKLMWWLTYRRSGRASGVVLIEAPSLTDARALASLEAIDASAEFAEGHELGAALAALVPAE